MIKFKFEFEVEEKQRVVFSDVPINGFFIDRYGNLCQRCTDSYYNMIATDYGSPFGAQLIAPNGEMEIKKILPEIKKITFE